MANDVFTSKSYRAVLEAYLVGEGNRGQLSRAARALGTQGSYLSRVINGEIQLTPDYAFKLTKHLKFTSDERDYFMTLVEYDRSADADYKKLLKERMEKAREKYDEISNRANRESFVSLQPNLRYFTSWQWAVIHFLVSVPEFQSAQSLSNRLSMSIYEVERYLHDLAEWGYVEYKNDKWKFKAGEFHAAKDSIQVYLHHQNWRGRAVNDSVSAQPGVHYTAVQTMSKEDAERIKEMILDSISRFSSIAGPSEPEDCFVFTCDFFRA